MKKDWQPEAESLGENWSYKELIKLSEADVQKMLIKNPSTYTELLMYAKAGCHEIFCGGAREKGAIATIVGGIFSSS